MRIRRGVRLLLTPPALLFLTLSALLCWAAGAQGEGAAAKPRLRVVATDVTRRPVVAVTVSVLGTGAALPPAALSVSVGGAPSSARANRLSNGDLQVAAILDTSAAVDPGVLQAERNALMELLVRLPSAAALGLVGSGRSDVPPQPITTDRSALTAQIGSTALGGAPDMPVSFTAVLTQLSGRPGGRRALVLVGGFPEMRDAATVQSMATRAARAGVIVYGLVPGRPRTYGLGGLVAQRGGRVWSGSALLAGADEVAADLLNQYRLVFPLKAPASAHVGVHLLTDNARSNVTLPIAPKASLAHDPAASSTPRGSPATSPDNGIGREVAVGAVVGVGLVLVAAGWGWRRRLGRRIRSWRDAIRQTVSMGGLGGEQAAESIEHAPVVPIRVLLRRFWPYLRPHRLRLAIALVLVVAQPAVETAEIWLFKVLVDDVLVPRHFGGFPRLVALFAGLAVVGGALSYADDVLSEWLSQRFLTDLRTDVFRHVQQLSLDFFERRRLGDLLSRLTSDVSSIETFLVSGLNEAASYAVRLVFFTVALFVVSWQLALVSFVVAPLFWLVARFFSKRIKAASRERRRRSGSLSAVAEESLGSAVLVQAYNRQDWEVDRFHRQAEAKYQAEMAATRLRALFSPIIESIETAGALVVVGIASWQLSRGQLTIGGLLVFLTFLAGLYGPLRGLSRLSTSASSASASAERVVELMEERPSVLQPARPRQIGRARGLVQFDVVSFCYQGTRRPVLSDVSVTVRPGGTVALVGASGAGKSTLTKLLLRFYDPDRGRILLDGIDLRDLDLGALRGNIAVLLQEMLVFDGTVLDNIAYGRPDATKRGVVAAARAADADEFIRGLPDGYDTRVGERGRRLSGGQLQRLAIARAIVRDAPVLVLDEPTTGLDTGSAQRIMAPLRRLMEGRSTIVISHNLLTTRDADEIVVLAGGRVADRGTHAELATRPGPYRELWRRAELDTRPAPSLEMTAP